MGSLKQTKKDLNKFEQKAAEINKKLEELRAQERELEDKDMVETIRRELSYEEFVEIWGGLSGQKRTAAVSVQSAENTNTERTAYNET